MSDFMSALKMEADRALPNVSVTENGAIGYKTAGKTLLDLNFMLSSMRNMKPDEIWYQFLLAYNENPMLAILWLFFARDVREGCGERRTFRIIFERLCRENSDIAIKLLPLIPFYGRWDDLTEIFFGDVPCKVKDEAFRVIDDQICDDLDNARLSKPVSLLAKWIPSANTSSKETRRRAEELRHAFGWTPKQYRKTLSRLRKYIDVVEQHMSANEWDVINYDTVPSRASLNYRDAFRRHDGERYDDYLTNVKEGNAKINAGVLFPYDIVHAYTNMWGDIHENVDETLEAQWKALPNKVPENGSTLVVVDGSGSMGSHVGNAETTCHDVARSLAIYFAEKLDGPYHDSFITFSANPKFVRFAPGVTLHAKLNLLSEYEECSNTNIEKTFDLILATALKHHLTQDDIPANILIVSDMEFDAATFRGGWDWIDDNAGVVDQPLFDTIAERWEDHGYKLPRLIFWNVCSRTGTIPVSENEFGVALVSGFSPNIADMVMSSELDPYKCLVDKLTSDRYKQVADALKE